MDKAESKAAKSSYGTNPVTTLIQWITRQETLNYQDLKDISQIVVALQTAFKIISDLLVTPLPLRSRIRISKGEQNLKEVANNLITESLLEFSCIFALISEMNEKPIFLGFTYRNVHHLCSTFRRRRS
ncbi:hypothetical protein O3M35_008616 [Rhynocoris fuscipes]|uniref:Uncharacterized protein n=1 Tax=Rhynocoris fuscipes TaxID=488301 RepID=A0AAW1DDW3_9HEMI